MNSMYKTIEAKGSTCSLGVNMGTHHSHYVQTKKTWISFFCVFLSNQPPHPKGRKAHEGSSDFLWKSWISFFLISHYRSPPLPFTLPLKQLLTNIIKLIMFLSLSHVHNAGWHHSPCIQGTKFNPAWRLFVSSGLIEQTKTRFPDTKEGWWHCIVRNIFSVCHFRITNWSEDDFITGDL